MQTLPGHVQTFYIKHQGRRLGPYYARVWQQAGRRRKQYVPAHLVEKVAAACQEYREMRSRAREKRQELERILSNLSFLKRCAGKANTADQLLPHEQEHVQRIRQQGIAAPGRPKIMRTRGFMGHSLRKRSLPPYQPFRPEPKSERPTANGQRPTPRVRRSWTLQRPLPDWLTEERLDQMMQMIPETND